MGAVGLTRLKSKNQRLSQMMMRGRVGFQALCVISLVGTLGHQDQFMEGAKFLYDRKMGNEEAMIQAIEAQKNIQRSPQKSVTEIVEQVQREHQEELMEEKTDK